MMHPVVSQLTSQSELVLSLVFQIFQKYFDVKFGENGDKLVNMSAKVIIVLLGIHCIIKGFIFLIQNNRCFFVNLGL